MLCRYLHSRAYSYVVEEKSGASTVYFANTYTAHSVVALLICITSFLSAEIRHPMKA
jgi:predicted Zn-dependent peptidase